MYAYLYVETEPVNLGVRIYTVATSAVMAKEVEKNRKKLINTYSHVHPRGIQYCTFILYMQRCIMYVCIYLCCRYKNHYSTSMPTEAFWNLLHQIPLSSISFQLIFQYQFYEDFDGFIKFIGHTFASGR